MKMAYDMTSIFHYHVSLQNATPSFVEIVFRSYDNNVVGYQVIFQKTLPLWVFFLILIVLSPLFLLLFLFSITQEFYLLLSEGVIKEPSYEDAKGILKAKGYIAEMSNGEKEIRLSKLKNIKSYFDF